MKISKKLRADAANICEYVGNNRFGSDDAALALTQITEQEAAEALGYVRNTDSFREVCDLAARAFCVIPDYNDEHSGTEWLEAAALLRDGWKPGDVPTLLDETAQAIVETFGDDVESVTVTRSTHAIDVDDEEYEGDVDDGAYGSDS